MLQQQKAMFDNNASHVDGYCAAISAGRPDHATLCKNTHGNHTTSQTTRYARTSAVGLWQYTTAINAITSDSKPTREIYVQVQKPDNVMISMICLNDVVNGSSVLIPDSIVVIWDKTFSV